MLHFTIFQCSFKGCRIFWRFELRAKRLHVGRDHVGAQLRNYARHAPQQEALVASRRLHHGRGLDLRPPDRVNAAHRGFGLQKVCDLPSVRDRLGNTS